MDNLPTREEAHRIWAQFDDVGMGASPSGIIVGARAAGTLQTESEWRDADPDDRLQAITDAWAEYVNAPLLKKGTKQQELHSLLDALTEEER